MLINLLIPYCLIYYHFDEHTYLTLGIMYSVIRVKKSAELQLTLV